MPSTIKILGYAGLIPFFGLAVLSLTLNDNTLVIDSLSLYAFGIFTFLCGAWWPTTDMQNAKFWRIVLSNVLFLTAFFVFLLLSNQWLAIGALLFILVWVIERFSSLIPQLCPSYSKMRTILTFVASLSMITTYLFGAA
jgi:apolipoprotein N-acyltransferase